ncbi:MAG: hypothetical protein RR450_07695, partial [Oscillospiraceae bacterium]
KYGTSANPIHFGVSARSCVVVVVSTCLSCFFHDLRLLSNTIPEHFQESYPKEKEKSNPAKLTISRKEKTER